MITAERQTSQSETIASNWIRYSDNFTGNDVIDAYLKGKDDGKNESYRILHMQFDRNINKAIELTEKLNSVANRSNIKVRSIYLRPDGITTFSALFVIDKNDYLDDKFRGIYVAARELKNGHIDDSFYISFSFMPGGESINTEAIINDGFILKHGEATGQA